MFIGSILFDIFIPHSSSLKEKRMVIKSFKEKVRAKFNVSVSEVGDLDKWQKSQIAVVFVAPTQNQAEKIMNNVINFVESSYPDIYMDIHTEIF
ncbi:MAG: DUF503 domain-containing protein [Persephonella sp.]|nr:MAG: DUF503 domain-containing protein [Persephonella sp.]